MKKQVEQQDQFGGMRKQASGCSISIGVERTYETIRKVIDKDRNMKIIGGDFNAEFGPGIGIEFSCVGHYTLNKANCRGEWMTQCLFKKKIVALNTMYKKIPHKQVTYHTPKGIEKQLGYILIDKKHYCWSKDAEANDMIHMGSDHGCVMAKFEIPLTTKRTRHNEATSEKFDGDAKKKSWLIKYAKTDSKQDTKTSNRKSKM